MNKYFKPFRYSSRAHCQNCNRVGFPGGDSMYDIMSSYLPLNPNHGFKYMCDLCDCLKTRYLAVNDCRDKKVVVYVTGHGPVTMYFSGAVSSGAVCTNLRRLNLFHCAFHVQDDGPNNTTFRVQKKRGDRRYLAIVYVPAQ